jgi:hypothetical protein
MAETFETHPDFAGSERVVILIHDGEDRATALLGYERDGDALYDLIGDIEAIFEANGRRIFYAPLAGEG